MTLEAYSRQRSAFRATVMAHKKSRQIHLGAHVTLIFEDELTMRYQVQEMLRAERIFEEERIQEELNAYNPLVPDGRNFKATMMLEYPDPAQREHWLKRLVGIEDKAWVRVDGSKKCYGIADEDLDRGSEGKTAAVHFLRFELLEDMISSLRQGAALFMGIDHVQYSCTTELSSVQRAALLRDLA
jgi:hypothetical protein